MTDIAEKIAGWRHTALILSGADYLYAHDIDKMTQTLREAADEAEHADLAWRMAMRRISRLEDALRCIAAPAEMADFDWRCKMARQALAAGEDGA